MGRTLAIHARRAGVTDARVLDVLVELDRAWFLPDGVRGDADEDRALSIGHGQTASQPSLQARMVEALQLQGTERVIELGTGAGFQTAMLCRLASEVWTMDVDATLSDRAARALKDAGCTNVHVVLGDGLGGPPPADDYHGVIVSFAVDGIPDTLVEGLVEGGRVVAPILDPDADPREGRCEVVVLRRQGAKMVTVEHLCGAHFVRARGPGRPT